MNPEFIQRLEAIERQLIAEVAAALMVGRDPQMKRISLTISSGFKEVIKGVLSHRVDIPAFRSMSSDSATIYIKIEGGSITYLFKAEAGLFTPFTYCAATLWDWPGNCPF